MKMIAFYQLKYTLTQSIRPALYVSILKVSVSQCKLYDQRREDLNKLVHEFKQLIFNFSERKQVGSLRSQSFSKRETLSSGCSLLLYHPQLVQTKQFIWIAWWGGEGKRSSRFKSFLLLTGFLNFLILYCLSCSESPSPHATSALCSSPLPSDGLQHAAGLPACCLGY